MQIRFIKYILTRDPTSVYYAVEDYKTKSTNGELFIEVTKDFKNVHFVKFSALTKCCGIYKEI